jgi:hypothetical protein
MIFSFFQGEFLTVRVFDRKVPRPAIGSGDVRDACQRRSRPRAGQAGVSPEISELFRNLKKYIRQK